MRYTFDTLNYKLLFPNLKSLKEYLKDMKYKHPIGRILTMRECEEVLEIFEKFGEETDQFDLVFSELRDEDFGGRQFYALNSKSGERAILSVKETIKKRNYQF